MTEKPEECKKFEEIIKNIMNKGKVLSKELNILLDNPLAFADFMSKYYNDCLKKRENTKKLFSMATLNNDNIKLLTTMNDGFEYIDNLSKEFNDLLSDISTLIGIIINKKIGENQAIIIINGLKKMFEIGSSPPINIERKAQIDNLLQTFMKRNSYNKVVKNPNKQNFKEHIIKEFGLNIHAYYNGMSLLHSLKYVKGEAQKLESSEESINEEEKEKESKIDKDDEELLLALLTYSRYFQTSKNNIKGGYFDLKQTKKNRLKNQQQNINKKKTHKKGGGNSEENKINNILEQEKFKKFFDESKNKSLREQFNKLDIHRKKLLIFYIYTRILKGKNKLFDEKPDNILSDDKLDFELFYDQNNKVNNSQLVNVTLDEIKKALNEKIEDNNNKSQLVESLSNYINKLNEDIEKKFWYYILSLEPKNKLDLEYPDWKILNGLIPKENIDLNQMIESLKKE